MRSLKLQVIRLEQSKKFLITKATMPQIILPILPLICSFLIIVLPLSVQATDNLLVTYYDERNNDKSAGAAFSGNVVQTENLATIDFTDINPASVTNDYSIIVEGFIYAATDGIYEFETLSDDGVRLMVDGSLVIDNWVNQSAKIRTATVNLVSGWKAIRIEHYEAGGNQRLRFRWKKPGESAFGLPQASDLSRIFPADPTNGNTTLAATPTSIVADGTTTSSVTVTLADANSNLLSASGGTVVLSSTGSAVISAVTDNADGTYTATVTNTVAESVTISGTLDTVAITDTETITFMDINSPTLVSSIPADNASSVELDQNIILNFSENIISGAGTIKLFEKNGLLVESFTVSSALISGSTVTLSPAVDFKYNTAYFIQIPATAFKDTAGNAYAGTTSNTALNFKTRLKTPKEGFIEVQEDIKTTIKSNTSKQTSIFLKATNTAVSSARDRFISNRIIRSRSDLTSQPSEKSLTVERDTQASHLYPARFANRSLIERDTETSFDLRSSTRGTTANGQINGLRQSNDDRTRRYTGTQFNYTKSTDKTETGGASSQVVFEQERSDDLTVGRFIGSTFSKHSKIDKKTTEMEIIIETVSLQFGSYFVHNITKDIFLDGYIAGSLLANKLEANTTSITAEADYISRMGAIGLAVTGSLPKDSWEIRPTLALDYSAVSSQDAKFEVASEGGDSNEIIIAENERQFSFTLAPDFRKSFDFKEGYWSQASIIAFKPKITCQRVYGAVITNECGQGATFNFTMQDRKAIKRIFFTLGVDKISNNTTYIANAFYKAEF